LPFTVKVMVASIKRRLAIGIGLRRGAGGFKDYCISRFCGRMFAA
jgi:hypothetical protein